MNDNQVEAVQQDSTIPRIRKDRIDSLHAQVEYVLVQPAGTTTTFVHAYLPGSQGRKFLLATGVSACVEPALFNAKIGVDIATAKAQAQAADALWQLEGYVLFKELNNAN